MTLAKERLTSIPLLDHEGRVGIRVGIGIRCGIRCGIWIAFGRIAEVKVGVFAVFGPNISHTD
jgi:hypothetical protein